MVYLMPRILCMWQIEIINFISCMNLLWLLLAKGVAQANASSSLWASQLTGNVSCCAKANGISILLCRGFLLLLEKFGKENLN